MGEIEGWLDRTGSPGSRSACVRCAGSNRVARARSQACSSFWGERSRARRKILCVLTTPPEKLDYLQRIQHADSFLGSQLAFVHYLFKAPALYRRRKDRTSHAAPAYVNGGTPFL